MDRYSGLTPELVDLAFDLAACQFLLERSGADPCTRIDNFRRYCAKRTEQLQRRSIAAQARLGGRPCPVCGSSGDKTSNREAESAGAGPGPSKAKGDLRRERG